MTAETVFEDTQAQVEGSESYPAPAIVRDMAEDDLLKEEIPEQEWAIPGQLLRVGLTYIVAPAKVGKTSLAYGVVEELAEAGHRVSYWALDDPKRRMQKRAKLVNPEISERNKRVCFTFAQDANITDLNDALTKLKNKLQQGVDEGNPFTVVVLDTHAQFVGPKVGRDVSGFDSSVNKWLQWIAAMYNCTILMTIHARKSRNGDEDRDPLETIGGTSQIGAGADTIWLLTRARGDHEGVLTIIGNDMEDSQRPMTLGEDQIWRPSAVTSMAQISHSGVPREVLEYLAEAPYSTATQIREDIGATPNTVKVALSRLSKEGLVVSKDKMWSLTNDPRNVPPGVLQVAPPSTPAPEADNSALEITPDSSPVEVDIPAPREAQDYGPVVLDMSGHSPDHTRKQEVQAAIPASMNLMLASVKRASRRLHPALFAPQPEEVDTVWKGTNFWETEVEDGTAVVGFDKRAAYLSAAKTKLPIGPLTHDEEGPVGAGQNKRVGYHLIQLPNITYPCGGPFHSRKEKHGEVWITTATLKQLNNYHIHSGRPLIPVLDSYTAPCTEVLLEQWKNVLRDKRAEFLEVGNRPAYDFVKLCYSTVISTMGESHSNFQIRRPDWRTTIESEAHALLWKKAWMAQEIEGCTVLKVKNTDEIWVVDDLAAAACFPEGTNLGQWDRKAVCVAGEAS